MAGKKYREAAKHIDQDKRYPLEEALQLVVTARPGNRIDVLPAGFGKLFVSVTVKVVPSLTISVGPGSCIDGH